MIQYKKPVAGNRYEITKGYADEYYLYDKTLQEVIAISDQADELIIYAQINNMINGDAVIVS